MGVVLVGSVGGCWCQWGPPHTHTGLCSWSHCAVVALVFTEFFLLCFVLLFVSVWSHPCCFVCLGMSLLFVVPLLFCLCFQPLCSPPFHNAALFPLFCALSQQKSQYRKPGGHFLSPPFLPRLHFIRSHLIARLGMTHILRKRCMLLWTVSVQWDCPKFIYQSDDRPVSRCSEFGKVSICQFAFILVYQCTDWLIEALQCSPGNMYCMYGIVPECVHAYVL